MSAEGESVGTVDKALGLLDHFSVAVPEWGLSDLARQVGYDKATTLRLLQALKRKQMIEQDAETKQFRLGTAFLHFAKVREESFPLATVLRPYLDGLAQETGETAHASLATHSAMTTIGISEPQRATRVWVDPSEPLPFHATASGLAFAAFGPASVTKQIADSEQLQGFTEKTHIDPQAVLQTIEKTRTNGYALSAQTFELETVGIAVPLFDKVGLAQGAIAVASPSMRMSDTLKYLVVSNLFEIALAAGDAIGSLIPESFRSLAKTRHA